MLAYIELISFNNDLGRSAAAAGNRGHAAPQKQVPQLPLLPQRRSPLPPSRIGVHPASQRAQEAKIQSAQAGINQRDPDRIPKRERLPVFELAVAGADDHCEPGSLRGFETGGRAGVQAPGVAVVLHAGNNSDLRAEAGHRHVLADQLQPQAVFLVRLGPQPPLLPASPRLRQRLRRLRPDSQSRHRRLPQTPRNHLQL